MVPLVDFWLVHRTNVLGCRGRW